MKYTGDKKLYVNDEIVYNEWSFRGVTIKNVPMIRNEFYGDIIEGNVMLNLMRLVDATRANNETVTEYKLIKN